MQRIKLSEIDYRHILLEKYKELGLKENEVMVLLLIDAMYKDKPSLITGDQLSSKMNLDANEIDKIIVELMNKSFLSYIDQDGMIVTSLENTYKKIVDVFLSNIIQMSNEDEIYEQETSFSKVLNQLQESMKRNLTPLEIDLVQSWFKDKIEERVIMQSISECIMKNNKVSVKEVDRLICKNLTHNDVVNEGFTTIDEKTKKDIGKTMETISYDWVNKK